MDCLETQLTAPLPPVLSVVKWTVIVFWGAEYCGNPNSFIFLGMEATS